MMSLYAVALKDIGIDSTLRKELDTLLLASLLLEHSYELRTDDLTLFLWLGNACELIEKTINCVNIDQISVHLIFEHLDYLFGLAFSQQTMINVNANQLLTYRFDKQCRDHRAIDTARQCEQHLFLAYLLTKLLDLLIDKRLRKLLCSNSLHTFGSDI